MMSTFYNNVKTGLLLGLLSGVVVLVGWFLGREQGLLIAILFAAVMNVGAYFFSDKIALASMHAQEVGQEHPLYQIVADLTRRANLPMPRVYVSPEQAPNAFATGRNPQHAAVCATEGLLQVLDRNEIAGVMAHELSHVRHRDILIQSVAATIAIAISFLAQMAIWGGGGRRNDDEEHGGGNILFVLAAAILAPVAAGLIQAAISRSREFNADKKGGEICGNPMYLATALEKIHAYANQIPMSVNPSMNGMFIAEPRSTMETIAGWFQTHPPLEARLMNLIGRESTGLLR
jgi:heat shock protein HtpX